MKALLDKALEKPIALRNIPEGLPLRSIGTTEDGVDARLTGTAVTFHASTESS